MKKELTAGEFFQVLKLEFFEIGQRLMLVEKSIMDFENRIREIELSGGASFTEDSRE